jgi:hypothetical protein
MRSGAGLVAVVINSDCMLSGQLSFTLPTVPAAFKVPHVLGLFKDTAMHSGSSLHMLIALPQEEEEHFIWHAIALALKPLQAKSSIPSAPPVITFTCRLVAARIPAVSSVWLNPSLLPNSSPPNKLCAVEVMAMTPSAKHNASKRLGVMAIAVL